MWINKFRFHTGSIKSKYFSKQDWIEIRFDSILVRLKGSTMTMKILYAIPSIRVKPISLFSIFRVDLLSTSGRANSLGG